MSTTRKRVAMVLAPNFEDSEAIEPKEYLESQGAEVTVIGLKAGSVPGRKAALSTRPSPSPMSRRMSSTPW